MIFVDPKVSLLIYIVNCYVQGKMSIYTGVY